MHLEEGMPADILEKKIVAFSGSILNFVGPTKNGENGLLENLQEKFEEKSGGFSVLIDFNSKRAGEYEKRSLIIEDVLKGLRAGGKENEKEREIIKEFQEEEGDYSGGGQVNMNLLSNLRKDASGKFAEYISELTKYNGVNHSVILFFNSTEQMPPELLDWVMENVINSIVSINRVLIVLAGKNSVNAEKYPANRMRTEEIFLE